MNSSRHLLTEARSAYLAYGIAVVAVLSTHAKRWSSIRLTIVRPDANGSTVQPAQRGTHSPRRDTPVSVSSMNDQNMPPGDAMDNLLAEVAPLMMTAEERFEAIKKMMAAMDPMFEAMTADLIPTDIMDMAYNTRVQVFEWLAGNDDDILNDDWVEILEGRGRWAR